MTLTVLNTTKKKRAAMLLEMLGSRETRALRIVHPRRFTQHDPSVPDGIEGIVAMIANATPGIAEVRIARAFQDANYVVIHSLVRTSETTARFDIFQFEGGQVIEHWSNAQSISSGMTVSGHTVIDGPAEVTDLDKTVFNKELAQRFVEEVLIGRRLDKISDYLSGDGYVQHDPNVADGVSGLGGTLQQLAKPDLTVRYDRIHKILGEGNFVLVVSEGQMGAQPVGFYDLFRLEDDRIVEQWDTVEFIPPPSSWKNQNGKFMF
jgi:predicted SnoaL-like aldol condensation-catalyzing enzyme